MQALPLIIVLTLGLLLVAWLAGQPLLQVRRWARLQRRPFPQAWRSILRRRRLSIEGMTRHAPSAGPGSHFT